jgi:hypothetical protein
LYTLMAPGEEYLAALQSVGQERKPAGAHSTRRVKRVRNSSPISPTPTKAGTPRERSAKGGKSARRPGPIKALEGLIADGYFATPRTTAEFLKYLQEERTLVYKATDMTAPLQRLVRRNALTRKRNAEGQYQYSAG